MTRFVLDCSATMRWCFEDETTPAAERILDDLSEDGAALVPPIWPFEVANALVMAERKNRITLAKSLSFLSLLRGLRITTDPDPIPIIWDNVAAIARSHRLTVYDAAYLELAIRSALPLATADRLLRAGANAVGVDLLEI